MPKVSVSWIVGFVGHGTNVVCAPTIDGISREPHRAESEVRLTLAAIEDGTYIPSAAGRRTVGALYPAWYHTKAARKRTTLRDYRSTWASRVAPVFGKRQVSAIERTDVIAWIVDMHAEGLSPGRIKRSYLVLAGILDYAVEEGLVITNVARSPRVRRALPKIPRRTIKQWEIMEPSEVEAMIAEAPARYQALLAVLAYGGLRFSEAVALQRQDVGPSGLDVTTAVVEDTDTTTGRQGRYLETVKDHEERFVRVPASLLHRLVLHMREFVPNKQSDTYLFTDPTGAWLSVSWFGKRVWKPALDAAGIAQRRMHRLRATAASLMLRSGGSLEFIRQQLGHADLSTSQRYLASFLGDEEAVIETMDVAIRESFRPHRDHETEGAAQTAEASEG